MNDRVTTTFLSQEGPTYLPSIDLQRIDSDHQLLLQHGSYSRKYRSATYHDIYQRRWYQINSSKVVEENEIYYGSWLKEILIHHIHSHNQPFNTVNIDEYGTATLEIKECIGPGIQGLPIISRSIFPIASYHEITQKRYFSYCADTCMWNGMNCFFKPIEEEYNIREIKREILLREDVLCHFGGTDNDWLAKHGISPIAIVLGDDPAFLYGILLPKAGMTLAEIPDEQITLQHLIALLKAVICLHIVEYSHGNVCEGNVCVQESSIQLIDVAERDEDGNKLINVAK